MKFGSIPMFIAALSLTKLYKKLYLEKVASLIRISQQILDKAHELWLRFSLFRIICLQRMLVEKDVSH